MAAAASVEFGPAQNPGSLLVPLISAEAKERVLGHAEAAREQCQVLLDEMGTGDEGSNLLRPLLVELQPRQALAAKVAQEEIFGPILALVPFDSEAEAVSLVNGTPYALTAGVYSRSPHTIRRMMRRIRAGNIYLNREITGARVVIEPFGGFQLSGTGPKAGGADYLWAFVRRRQASPITPAHVAPAGVERPTLSRLRPWDDLEPEMRAQRLAQGLSAMAASAALARAAAQEFGPGALEEALALGINLLERRGELIEPQPTSPIWGQRNYLSWDTPRGVGLVVTGEGSKLKAVMGLLLGSLLAGNGIAALVAPGHRKTARLIVEELRRAGVPLDG
ncbi:MAG: aldehyde dehydrogenase family protein, partial [Chloroflexota bacterium]